jgi:elongation factor Ts
MSRVSIEQIKNLRQQTGAGVMEVKRALDAAAGDVDAAKKILKEQGQEIVAKKSQRKAADGRVFSYIHATGRIGSMIELFCETDFVARTDDFRKLGHELAMQIAATNPQNADGLLSQEYIRDPSKTVRDLTNETIAKVGENVKIGRMVRYEI